MWSSCQARRSKYHFEVSMDMPRILVILDLCHRRVHIDARFLYVNGMCMLLNNTPLWSLHHNILLFVCAHLILTNLTNNFEI
jgi:uncharacterized protein (DUF983 family)